MEESKEDAVNIPGEEKSKEMEVYVRITILGLGLRVILPCWGDACYPTL